MIIKRKNVLIFPEYHLTDFPPQFSMSQKQASLLLKPFFTYGFDLIISGYVETSNGLNYSSCIICDQENIYNVRKRFPDKKEIEKITAGETILKPTKLSIGTSYFLICKDISVELKNGKMDQLVEKYQIENLFLISAMFYNFQKNVDLGKEYIKKKNIQRFIIADRFNGIKQFEI